MKQKKQNKEHFKFDWRTAIITLFIGFFFTKLITPLLEQLFSSFLQLGGIFINSIADSTYKEISKGFCEQGAYFTANYILGIYLVFLFILFTYLKTAVTKYFKTLDSIDKTNSILNDDYKQEEAIHATTTEDLPTTDGLRKKIKTTYFLAIFSFALVILLLSYSFGSMSYINNVITKTTNNIEIVAPYVSDNEYKMLKSTFHSMQNKSDYEILTERLNSIAEQYSLHLK